MCKIIRNKAKHKLYGDVIERKSSFTQMSVRFVPKADSITFSWKICKRHIADINQLFSNPFRIKFKGPSIQSMDKFSGLH